VQLSGAYNVRRKESEERQSVIHIRLPEGEAQRLETAFRKETDPKYKQRLQIIRLASRDRPHQQIAQDLAITPRTVQRWLNAYLEQGLDGLRPRKPPGAPGKIPALLADEIRRWVIEGPSRQGLDRAGWTHEELADQLYKTHGIQTSRSAVQRYCAKIDIRLYRPTYRYLRGDPQKQAQARQDIAELKKKQQQMRSSC
jgi:transposase